MTLAVPAKAGAWCDTSTKVSGTVAAALVGAGYVGVARYVPLPNNSPASDIDKLELQGLLAAGLQVLLVQHVRRPPWVPADHDPLIDAVAAIEHSRHVGYPQGCHLILDFEGAAGGPGPAYFFCDRWSMAVVESGYRAGLYVGFSAQLSAQQLYDLEYVDSYWSDAGHRDVAERGFALKQGVAFELGGVGFDEDTMAPDLKGEVPYACAAA